MLSMHSACGESKSAGAAPPTWVSLGPSSKAFCYMKFNLLLATSIFNFIFVRIRKSSEVCVMAKQQRQGPLQDGVGYRFFWQDTPWCTEMAAPASLPSRGPSQPLQLLGGNALLLSLASDQA